MKKLTSLLFAFAASSMLSLFAADVRLLGISKIEDYIQTEAGPPEVNSPGAFSFYAFVDLANENSVRAAAVYNSEGDFELLEESRNPLTLDYLDFYDNPAQLELWYPPGEYFIELATQNDGEGFVTFFLPQPFYPNAPYVLNWSELQRSLADQPIDIRWEPFAEGTDKDFISLTISDLDGNVVFETPKPGVDPNALRGTASSVRLPANTLRFGNEYRALLMFARVVNTDTNSYPGVPAVTSFVRQTLFPIVASGTPDLSKLNFELSFTYLAYGGDFENKTSVQPEYPIPFDDCYVARLFVLGEEFVPTISDVTFTSPLGTGIVELESEFRYVYDDGIFFETPCLDNPTNALRGEWTIGYNGYPLIFNVPDARPIDRLVVPTPSVTLEGDVIRRVDWVYHDWRGNRLNVAPLFITNQVVEFFNDANFIVFSSTNLARSVSTLAVTEALKWSEVREMHISYRDNFGNWYGITFYHSPPPGLTIANEYLPNGSLNTPYRAQMVAENGTPPYRWWLDGRLPPGLTLSPSGLISGTPLLGGHYNFAIRVDDQRDFDYEQFNITITADGPPVILEQPEGGIVDIGDFTYFEVLAEGTQPLSYQWFFEGKPIDGETNEWLLLFEISGADAGEYAVRVTNPVGSVISEPAELIVWEPPVIVTQPQSQEVAPGTDVTFTVEVRSAPPIFYQWRRNGEVIENANGANYTIRNAQPRDAGTYSVFILGGQGFVESEDASLSFAVQTVVFTNRFANRIEITGASGLGRSNNRGASLDPNEPRHAGMPGGSSVWATWVAPASGIATFDTRGSSFDTLLAIYTGDDISQLVEIRSDDDGAEFYTSEVLFNVEAGRRYQIAIDGVYGEQGTIVLNWSLDTSGARIPEILRQPRDAIILEGGTATFSVQAINPAPATGPLTYFWYFNGVEIPGANSDTLVVPNVDDSKLGWYIVSVENETHFVFSDWVVIEVVSTLDVAVSTEDKLANVPLPAQGLLSHYPEPLGGGGSVARGYTGSQVFNTHNSTTESSEPNHCGVIGGASQWFSYLAVTNGLLTITTDGSDFDTILGVYTGADLDFASLKQVACDNDGGLDGKDSRVAFQAVAGTLYLLVVDGVQGAKGTATLNYNLNRPPALTVTRVGTQMQMRLTGDAQGTFIIQSSNNLNEWTTLITTNSPTGVVDWSSRGLGTSFYYRAQQIQ